MTGKQCLTRPFLYCHSNNLFQLGTEVQTSSGNGRTWRLTRRQSHQRSFGYRIAFLSTNCGLFIRINYLNHLSYIMLIISCLLYTLSTIILIQPRLRVCSCSCPCSCLALSKVVVVFSLIDRNEHSTPNHATHNDDAKRKHHRGT